MTTAPLLDRREFQEIVDAVLGDAGRTVPEWRPESPGDVGYALVAIYAHFMEILLDRLNRAPQKNLIAFLDLMGVSLLPPGAARAPLVFTLAPGAGEAGFVPRGTQVATTQTETEPAVVFETQASLTVVAAQLVDAFAIEPRRDRYADRGPAVRGEDPVIYDPFRGELRMPHTVYLGLDAGQPLLDAVSGTLLVDVDRPVAAGPLAALRWEVRRGGTWESMPGPTVRGSALVFPDVNGPDATLEVEGAGLPAAVERRWLRGTARTPVKTVRQAYSLRLRAQLGIEIDELWMGRVGDTESWARVEFDEPYTLGSSGLGALAVTSRLWDSGARLHLRIDPERSAVLPSAWFALSVVWEYFSVAQDDWLELGRGGWRRGGKRGNDELPPRVTTSGAGFADTTEGFQRAGWVSAARPSDFKASTPPELASEGLWLRAHVAIFDRTLKKRLPFEGAPVLGAIMVSPDVPADAAASGTDLLDVTAPMVPFGPNPQPNATFYVASREALSQRGARVTLFLPLDTPGRPAPRVDLQAAVDDAGGGLSDVADEEFGPFRLVWEYPREDGWALLGETRLTFVVSPEIADTSPPYRAGLYPWVVSQHDVSGLLGDTTEGLARSGEIEFLVPEDLVPATVGGVESAWIRARLAEGDYGRVQEFVLPVDVQSETPAALVPKLGTGTLLPPSVASASFAYDYPDGGASIAPTVLALNRFRYVDHTADNKAGTAPYALLEPPKEERPTFYLGLDRKLPNVGVSLYVAVPVSQAVERLSAPEPPTSDDDSALVAIGDITETTSVDLSVSLPGSESQLVWEYWNGLEWTELVVADDTRDLTESGTIQFLGPADAAALAAFGLDERYWIRVMVADPSGEYARRVSGIFLNAVGALQAATIRNELVGSSNGEKSQVFRLAQAPVADSQRIVVREPERPPEDEAARLRDDEGEDVIEVRPVADGADQVWVRWHEVPTLAGSDEKDRHYTLDRISGELRFGDGVFGVIPPPGTNNIVAELYVAGGTPAGNREAGAVSQLKSSIPYVAAVTNPIAADGGSGAETLEDVQLRGPYSLRNAGRALSEDDFEWLARGAVGSRVARAQTLANRDAALTYRPGWTTLIVVPRSAERKPIASAQLVREVEDFFALRTAAALTRVTPSRLNVIGPGYVPVELDVEIRPRSFAEADLVRTRVARALDAFFQPLTGGPGRVGWPFGCDIFLSEVFAELEAVDGVEHVHMLRFKATVATTPLRLPTAAPEAHPAGELFVVSDGGYELGGPFPVNGPAAVGRLVEDLPDAGVDAMVTFFQEGQRIRLTAQPGDSDGPETTIVGISGSRLTVEPFRAPFDLPVGTWAVTLDDAPTGATLAAAVPAGSLVETLAVTGLELAGKDFFAFGERLRIPSSHLVCSGTHTITATQS
jgi:Baseplate J-like protein